MTSLYNILPSSVDLSFVLHPALILVIYITLDHGDLHHSHQSHFLLPSISPPVLFDLLVRQSFVHSHDLGGGRRDYDQLGVHGLCCGFVRFWGDDRGRHGHCGHSHDSHHGRDLGRVHDRGRVHVQCDGHYQSHHDLDHGQGQFVSLFDIF